MDFTPKGIVIHGMGRYIDWEQNLVFAPDFLDKIGLGANGFIDIDGKFIEGKAKGFKTAHAGISYHKEKNIKWLNSKYIGYEVLVENAKNLAELNDKMYNDPTCYYNEQYLTLAKKCYQDMKIFNFDESYIVKHSEVSGDDIRGQGKGKTDPGDMFDWDKFIGYIQLEKL